MPKAPEQRARGARSGGGWLHFEHRRHAVLPWPAFVRRVATSVALASAIIGGSLVIGMLGYHGLEGLPWIDSFLNASMILSGMGPLWSPRGDPGKIFAGLYALYSGLAVLVIAGLILAPLAHRLLHRFHAEEDEPDPSQAKRATAKKSRR